MIQHDPGRPATNEHAEYFGLYIGKVDDRPILANLESQLDEIEQALGTIQEADASVLHEPYTWTIKQVVGHLIDVERVFSYRALRFASGDDRSILGMDQNHWVDNTDYETPRLRDLVDELKLCRQANLCMFKRLGANAWDRRAAADGNEMTVRAAAYCLVGHITYHLEIIRSRLSP